jgi:Dolichyl-phosphate-mannose-protein mannosyltransferase
MNRQNSINRYFPLFVYVFCFIISSIVLWQGRTYSLFAMPQPGMDQLNFLNHANNILKGILPDQTYKLSSSYTFFLAFLSLITGGKIVIMRLLQIALCSLIPVVIFKLCRLLRCSFISSQAVALLYCFYGTAVLVSIGFLRAAPLALCFIGFVYLLVKGFYSKKWNHYLLAGLLAGLTISGRENFIPIVMAPFIMLIFPTVRKHVKYQKAVIYFAGILIFIIPLIMYNYVRFDLPEIIPGNFVHAFKFYHGEANIATSEKLAGSILERVPSQVKMFASSYEAPNGFSFYAHREIITLLEVLLVPFNLILAMAILALFLDFKRLRSLFVGGMAAGYFLTIIYFSMFYRYRIVDAPLLFVLCGISIHLLIQAKPQKFKCIFSAIFVLGFFFLTYTLPDKLRTGSERRTVIKFLINRRDYYKAERLIDKLVEDKVPLNNLEKYLVISLDKDGYKDDAKRLFIKYAKYRRRKVTLQQ